mmetsp:Transcript_11201/g.16380  ORF Transcript_11201/g.16380 Transcript_11201/m.16380 type:complete len:470 (-) Transcript_11201:251-1660(-)|eukprot:CAMPEP_0195523932 /NCGR_PEP_ID=MMETSP0794_2-20130614/23443_1 /TAXON_ID=515487 /ORGANISM="Stephanopyxis turris, Strain CCMP 815" /LENGTH=469 /DNA_ID=CAMNT_0040654037 /DNA_START=53 /DNA_END=1462 /DNA_ORIENTATION=+
MTTSTAVDKGSPAVTTATSTDGSFDGDAMLHHSNHIGGMPNGHEHSDDVSSPIREVADKGMTVVRMGSGRVSGPKDPCDWGIPGELTENEVDVYEKFRTEVEKRGGEFRETVYSFGEIEGEPYTLCRWLRARKFNLENTIKMVEEASDVTRDARKFGFYPDPKAALGSDPSIFMTLYPQLYSGKAKNGCPLFISKPGVLNVDAVECITSIDGILKYHWYVMMHDYAGRLRAEKEADKNFTRFECCSVLDLDHLTSAQLSQRCLNIIKTQMAVDSVCFPETMNKMVIVNAPRFFAMTWKLIKGWIDPRTANKIEIISSRSKWEARLRELVDADQLPSDYGGKGESTTDTLLKDALESGLLRRTVELLHVRTNASIQVDLNANEKMRVEVYSKSVSGAKFSINDASKKTLVKDVVVKHNGKVDDPNETPTCVAVTTDDVKGPGKLKIRADSLSGRFQSNNYLVVANVYSIS